MKFSFHHVAHVVANIQEKYLFYQKLGFSVVDGFVEPQTDSEQKVIVGVVKKDNFTIELLAPLHKTSPVYSFLQKGGGLHHLCYEVQDMDEGIAYMKTFARQVTPVTTSVWDNRPVTFFVGKDGDIIELIG